MGYFEFNLLITVERAPLCDSLASM